MSSKLLYPGKLIQYSDNVFTTPYSLRKYKEQTKKLVNVGCLVVPELIKILDLNKDQKYIVKPFYNKEITAFVLPSQQTVFLNPVFDHSLLEYVASYCHESIHLSQMKVGDLTRTNTGALIWKGQTIPYKDCLSYSKNINEYRELPWENDVSIRLPGIFQAVCKNLGLK